MLAADGQEIDRAPGNNKERVVVVAVVVVVVVPAVFKVPGARAVYDRGSTGSAEAFLIGGGPQLNIYNSQTRLLLFLQNGRPIPRYRGLYFFGPNTF